MYVSPGNQSHLYCNISDAGAESLAAGLNRCTLQRIDLSWNSIGDEGAEALAKALSSLKKIDLSENRIGSGIKSIVESFPLAVVFFYGNPIGVVGA